MWIGCLFFLRHSRLFVFLIRSRLRLYYFSVWRPSGQGVMRFYVMDGACFYFLMGNVWLCGFYLLSLR